MCYYRIVNMKLLKYNNYNKKERRNGCFTIGFLELLCLLFIGLKLANIIDWHWLLVLLPLWFPVAFAIGILLFLFFLSIFLLVINKLFKIL